MDILKADNRGQNVLHKAAEEGHHDVVVIVIDHLEEDEDTLKTLMSKADTRGNTPFMLAVQSGHHKTLETFIARANSKPYVDKPNKDNECPLHMACRCIREY